MKITIAGGAQLQALARRVDTERRDLRRNLGQGLRNPTDRAVRAARRAVADVPIRGYRTGSPRRFTAVLPGGRIRQRIADAIRGHVYTTGASPRAVVEVDTARLGNAARVPAHLESGKTFRHPLPGNERGTWAGSRGAPWFHPSTQRAGDYAAQVQRVLDGIRRRIEEG